MFNTLYIDYFVYHLHAEVADLQQSAKLELEWCLVAPWQHWLNFPLVFQIIIFINFECLFAYY